MANTSAAPTWANPSGAPPPTIEDDGQSMLLAPFSTLDEPVAETIMRDVRAVASKLRVVMLPLDRTSPFGYSGVDSSDDGDAQPAEELSENQKKVLERLKDWDLWGPLVVCLAMSVLLSLRAPTNQASMVFAAVFLSVWVGSAIVTLNAQLLGSNISFFQSVCVMGYCVFPMLVAALVVGLLKLTPIGWWWLDLIWIVIAFLWATRASTVFIGLYIPTTRRALAVFPVCFFYVFIGWLILLF